MLYLNSIAKILSIVCKNLHDWFQAQGTLILFVCALPFVAMTELNPMRSSKDHPCIGLRTHTLSKGLSILPNKECMPLLEFCTSVSYLLLASTH
jgi:hypothetical protein